MLLTLRVSFLILLLCCIAKLGFSQKKKLFGFSSLDDTVATDKSGFLLVPMLYYTPDTRWAYGAAGVYYFRIPPRHEHEKQTRVSYVQFLADYTQNKQSDVWSVWNIFSRNENFLHKGELRFREFPDRFYGIGNTTRQEDVEKYAYNLISIKSLTMKQVRPSLFLGIDYHFEYEYNFKYTVGGTLEQGNITGYKGGIGSAIGLVGVYDTRDNAINAHRGKLAELSTFLYTPALGSTFSFFNINGTYQRYWKVKPGHILALQSKMRLSYGKVPFLDLATAGGDDLLRGYPKNRFRDNHFAGAQLEYRFPVVWRLGLVTFAGAGDVFRTLNDFGLNALKYSVGSGLRFLVNPAERLNIRFDYAWGREGGYYYFALAESF